LLRFAPWAVIAVVSVVGVATAGCSSGSSRPSAKAGHTPARGRSTSKVPVCGWLQEGRYTESEIVVVTIACPEAAAVVRGYARARRAPSGWKAKRSCVDPAGAPGATRAGCFVVLADERKRRIAFIEGTGRRGGAAPPAVVRLTPGDGRQL
jgi:hypothetical protein